MLEEPTVVDFLYRPPWLEARRCCVTGTDVGRIVHVSKWGGPLEVFAEKMGVEAEQNERMLIGRELQTGIASAYHQLRSMKTGEPCEIKHAPPFALAYAKNPRHAASLDCWQRFPGGQWHPLEIKSTTGYVVEPYDEWLTQVQWQMYVTNSQRATIAALRGGDDIEWWDIDRDDSIIIPLAEAADTFLVKHLDTKQAPPPDIHDAAAVKRLFAFAETGTEVTLGMEDLDVAINLISTKEEIAALEARKDALQAQLQARMGTAEVAFLPNGQRLTWKNQSRKSYIVPASNARVFRIEKPVQHFVKAH